MKNKCLLGGLLGLCFIATNVYASSMSQGQQQQQQQMPQQGQEQGQIPTPGQSTRYSLAVSSTIYKTAQDKIVMTVTIPRHFRPLETAAQAAKLRYLEFIPQNDDKNNWSQVITLQILGDKKLTSEQYTQLVKTETANKVKNLTVLMEENVPGDKYNTSVLALSYEHNNRHEVVFMRYFSSSNYLTGIQYAKTYTENQDPKAMVKDMVDFVNTISKVVDTKITPPGEKELKVKFGEEAQSVKPEEEKATRD